MTKEAIINKTIQIINKLPANKAEEISDFADFLIKKYEEQSIIANIQKLTSDSEVFNFLAEDPEIYSIKDLKERFND